MQVVALQAGVDATRVIEEIEIRKGRGGVVSLTGGHCVRGRLPEVRPKAGPVASIPVAQSW
jgi:hypothetical protein